MARLDLEGKHLPPLSHPWHGHSPFSPGTRTLHAALLRSAKGERARDWQSGELSFRPGPYSDIARVTLGLGVRCLTFPVYKRGLSPSRLSPVADLVIYSADSVQCFYVPASQEAFRPRRSSNSIPVRS